MSDGAHLGVGAERALKTILGGEPHPTESEMESREQVRKRVMAAPDLLTDPGPGSYGEACDCMVKAFIILIEEDVRMLDKGVDLYECASKRWPRLGRWLRGPTGFMVGWATNCARWLYEQSPVPNPAIVEMT